MEATELIDTHCHLDNERLAEDRADILARARNAGITDIILPGVWINGFASIQQLAENASSPVRLHAAFGLHPQVLPLVPPQEDAPALATLRQQCSTYRPVAVGECGLDYRVDMSAAPRERQRAVLRAQLELARELRIPVLLHCLSAHEDLVREIDAVGGLPAGGVMHSFSGSAQQVAAFVQRGLHLSFAGPISWPGARKPAEAARCCPAERLLCETDAPDQPPHPHRGERNEPAMLLHVLRALAAAREEPVATTARLCTENARRVFRLGGPADTSATP